MAFLKRCCAEVIESSDGHCYSWVFKEGLCKDHYLEKLQHQLEIQTKRVENLKDYVKLHLPPIFDSECEGCRCAESASIKGLKIDQELEKELENLK